MQINATETQLGMLETKRQLLRAQTLSHEGQRLFEQIDELLNGNADVVQGNPVWTVRELLRDALKLNASDVRVTQFLSAKVDRTGEARKLKIPVERIRTQKTRKPSFQQFEAYPPVVNVDRSRQSPVEGIFIGTLGVLAIDRASQLA